MSTYAVSVMASRQDSPTVWINRHIAFLVRAVSVHEAIGKGMVLAGRVYPTADGWTHNITTSYPDDYTEADSPLNVQDFDATKLR